MYQAKTTTPIRTITPPNISIKHPFLVPSSVYAHLPQLLRSAGLMVTALFQCLYPNVTVAVIAIADSQ